MDLSKDFREFIELLNEHKVAYLVVGGYAVNLHGYPRYTKDIDFWIWMTDDNISRLLEVIRSFGMGSLGLTHDIFRDPDSIIQLGYEPHRIDLLMDINGVDFEKCYADRKTSIVDKVEVNFLNINDLIKAKKEAGRLQDLADAEQLEKLASKLEEE
jgi:hypothetical protein